MADLLGILNIFNLAFQKDNLKLSTMNFQIEDIKKRLETELLNPVDIEKGTNLKAFFYGVEVDQDNVHLFKGISYFLSQL